MKKPVNSNIIRKISSLAAASVMTLVVAVPAMGTSTYHYFFDDTSTTINSSTVVSTKSFTSTNETHTVHLHPKEITKKGNIYVARHKKSGLFWNTTRTYKFDINSVKDYISDKSSALNGTYYYGLSSYDEDNIESGANVTFDAGFIEELS